MTVYFDNILQRRQLSINYRSRKMMSSSRAASKFLSCSRRIYDKSDFIIRSVSKTSLSQARIVEVVPALGESITEGSIASWSKNIGDHVAIDDVIVIVETDKVTVDIRSTNSGVLVAKLAEDNVSFRAFNFCSQRNIVLLDTLCWMLAINVELILLKGRRWSPII